MVETLLEQVPWLTPTTLFILLNVVIATILLSSAFHKKPHHQHHGGGETHSSASSPPLNPPPLARNPSLFSRVTSFNFSNYYPSNDHNQQHQLHNCHSSPSFFSRVGSFNLSGRANEPDPVEPMTRSIFSRVTSFNMSTGLVNEPDPDEAVTRVTNEAPTVARAPSLLSRVASFTYRGRGPQVGVGEIDARRSYSSNSNSDSSRKVEKVKKSKKKKVVGNETATFKRNNDEEVDAKADDFINRFKQQLKLQRIESLMRYRSA